MMTQKLNQVLSIERTVKSKANERLSKLHHVSTKVNLFNGFSKNYKPLREGEENFPPESLQVQMTSDEALKSLRRTLSDLFDVVATKDCANTSAAADVVVDGTVILQAMPATTLIFIEKQLIDIQTFVSKLPTLDPSQQWNFDDATSLWKTPTQKTHKTKKVQRPLVLYQATPEHPAQTQIITEDRTVGHWETVKQSGALQKSKQEVLLERIEKLLKAVKFAREAANAAEAPEVELGGKVFSYLFNE